MTDKSTCWKKKKAPPCVNDIASTRSLNERGKFPKGILKRPCTKRP